MNRIKWRKLLLIGGLIILLGSLGATGVGAEDLLSSYYFLQEEYPEFIQRLKDGGASEGHIIAFLNDLDSEVMLRGPLNDANFNTILNGAVQDVVSRSKHGFIFLALLRNFKPEIAYQLEYKKLHPNMIPLRNAVKKSLLGSGEPAPGTGSGNTGTAPAQGELDPAPPAPPAPAPPASPAPAPPATGNTGTGAIPEQGELDKQDAGTAGNELSVSKTAGEVKRQLAEGVAVVRLAVVKADDVISVTGETLAEVYAARKELEVTFPGVQLRLPADAVKLGGDQTLAVSVSSLNSAKTKDLVQVLPPGQKLVGSIYEIYNTTEDSVEGVEFAKPVTVVFSYAGADLEGVAEDRLDVFYYDEFWKEWQQQNGTVDPANKTVSITTKHFSKYAIMAYLPGIKGNNVIVLGIASLEATVNNEKRTLDAVPYIKDVVNRTMVPVRFVSEMLGAQVDWLEETRQVRIKEQDKEILLTIGSNGVLVNGQNSNLDSPAEIMKSRTFVPLRFVSENLGSTVHWNATDQSITISK